MLSGSAAAQLTVLFLLTRSLVLNTLEEQILVLHWTQSAGDSSLVAAGCVMYSVTLPGRGDVTLWFRYFLTDTEALDHSNMQQ